MFWADSSCLFSRHHYLWQVMKHSVGFDTVKAGIIQKGLAEVTVLPVRVHRIIPRVYKHTGIWSHEHTCAYTHWHTYVLMCTCTFKKAYILVLCNKDNILKILSYVFYCLLNLVPFQLSTSNTGCEL